MRKQKMIYCDEELSILITRIESAIGDKSFSRVVKEALRLWINKNMKGKTEITKDPFVLIAEAYEIMKKGK